MSSKDNKVVVAFNGEIYNFRTVRQELGALGHEFRTASDTEVIVNAYRQWGKSFVSRLEGMFAIALYDSISQEVHLIRDRLGKKPLYIAELGGTIVWGSELKALLLDRRVSRRVNHVALRAYLAYGYVPSGLGIFEDAKSLDAATICTYQIDSGRITFNRYWTLPEGTGSLGEHREEELLEEFDLLIRDAVDRRLVSDRPIGILLSGGLDSSTIAATAAASSSIPVRTFAVTFPDELAFDEGRYARDIAKHIGAIHTEVPVTGDRVSVEAFLKVASHLDEPFADQSVLPTYLLAAAVKPFVTVALGGDGADELFGGYPHYRWIQQAQTLRGLLPTSVRGAISTMSQRALPIGTRGRNHLIGLRGDASESIAHVNVYFDQWAISGLIPSLYGPPSEFGTSRKHRPVNLADPMGSAMKVDLETTLRDGYLTKVDRASMLAAVEIRSPFLDYRLVEFCIARIPTRWKITGDGSKLFLKSYARSKLPRDFDFQRKQGFSLPLQKWVNGAWRTLIDDILAGLPRDVFDKSFVQRMSSNEACREHNANRLFSLATLEIWRRRYQAQFV